MTEQYRIGHKRPSGDIEWMTKLYTEEEATRECEAANYAEMGGGTLQKAGHASSDGQDSGFRWVYEKNANQKSAR